MLFVHNLVRTNRGVEHVDHKQIDICAQPEVIMMLSVDKIFGSKDVWLYECIRCDFVDDNIQWAIFIKPECWCTI